MTITRCLSVYYAIILTFLVLFQLVPPGLLVKTGQERPCKPFRYVPPQRVGFLRRFDLKTGIDFAHFVLESGRVYEGTTVVYQCVRRFNSK